jgi:hypothetical protein
MYKKAEKTSILLVFSLIATVGCADTQSKKKDPCDSIDYCPVPQAPTLDIIHVTTLQFSVACFSKDQIQVGASRDLNATKPDKWIDDYRYTFSDERLPYSIKIFARVKEGNCVNEQGFSNVYEVRTSYPPAPGEDGSTAISINDPGFSGWATGWVKPVSYGKNVSDKWKTPVKATGRADGTPNDIVSLGDGGEIIMTFDTPIRNRSGYDFAVFENATVPDFLELAYVEVSSNGDDFVRFDNAYLGKKRVESFGRIDTTLVGSLAGKYPIKWGTPFDLRVLANKPDVLDGKVDLNDIRYVKIVDIVGDGSCTDSFGNIIYDPYPTEDSAGLDLEAIGVLNK